MATLDQLLNPDVIINAISRIKTPMSRLQDFYGLGPGAIYTQQVPGKNFSWDIFDNVRTIATARAPGSGPATTDPQPIGNVSAQAYRVHEKIALLHERIFRTRPIGGMLGEIDSRGTRYIQGQERRLAQRFRNSREFVVSRMFRGDGFGIRVDGDNHVPVAHDDPGAHFTIDFQVPADHKGDVGGIFAGNWTSAGAATAVPHDELLNLNARSEQDTGYPIKHAWCTGTNWANMLKLDQIRQLAGTANQPFAEYDRVTLTNEDGIQDTGFTCVLRGIPWLVWHVYEGVLNVDGTVTKVFEDNKVLFTPDPNPAWLEMYEGSEIVKTNYLDGGTERFGLAAWATDTIDPAGYDLKALDVFLPALYLPKAIYYATVA